MKYETVESEECPHCHERFGRHEPRVYLEEAVYHLDCARYAHQPNQGIPCVSHHTGDASSSSVFARASIGEG